MHFIVHRWCPGYGTGETILAGPFASIYAACDQQERFEALANAAGLRCYLGGYTTTAIYDRSHRGIFTPDDFFAPILPGLL